MKTLWENTLVPVLRDLQWLQHVERGGEGIPVDIMQVLDGGAESMVGDMLFSSQSRFFVFELKSDIGAISSEWETSTGKSKALYVHLRSLVASISQASAHRLLPDSSNESLLKLSLRGHFFVYPQTAQEGLWRIGIWADSYILAATEQVKHRSRKMTLLPNLYAIVPNQSGSFPFARRVPIEDVMREGMCIASTPRDAEEGGSGTLVGDLGLTKDELGLYLSYLSTAGGNGELRTVVADREGRFFAVIQDIKDLERVLERLQSPIPLIQKKMQARPSTPGRITIGRN